jgi:hypothetical protein
MQQARRRAETQPLIHIIQNFTVGAIIVRLYHRNRLALVTS